MKSETFLFKELSFSKLFCDYIQQTGELKDHFQYHPTSDEALLSRIKTGNHSLNPALKDALLAYNEPSRMHPKALENLNALLTNPKTRTIVTGQQVTFAGGTMFTIYKILTAIVRAAQIEKLCDHKVVPIFWVADEDHDFDEISRIGFPVENGWSDFILDSQEILGQGAGQTPVQETISEFIDSIEASLLPTDHRDDIIKMLRTFYIHGSMHTDSFAGFITHLFSHFGLLIFGSAKPEARKLVKDQIVDLIDKSPSIYTALENSSTKIEKSYHRQASLSKSNWFLVIEDGVRIKLNFENGVWSTIDGHSYTTEELKNLVKSNPNALSPNVFMRPLLQDFMLPNLALVGGPGEIAYYAQMKLVYEVCEMEMPVIIPRFSATIFESSTRKYFNELSFTLPEYNNRIEDLEKKFVESTQDFDLDSKFELWSQELSKLVASHISMVEAVDITLFGTLKKVESDQLNTLNQLKGKMFKALKNKQDVQLKRISRVQQALFPNGNLQERELAFIYILNKYGVQILDDLYQLINNSTLEDHHLLDL